MTLRPFVVLVLLIQSLNLAAADYSSPTGRVQDLTTRIIDTIQNNPQNRNARWTGISTLIYDGFDFRSMAQGILLNQWRRASEDERRKFTDFFSQYLEVTYSTAIQNIIYRDELIEGEMAIIQTVLHAGAEVTTVDFRLKDNDGIWFAYDVVVDGISLVENYRTLSNAINQGEGMEALTSDVQRRISRFRDQAAGFAEDS